MDSPAYHSRVAAEVRAELARRQITSSALSDAIGIPGATLSRRLNGQSPFDIEELNRIASFLDVSVASFLPATNSTSAERIPA